MSRTQLLAKIREVTGRKVRALRREGVIPGVVYGVKSDPVNVQVQMTEVLRLIRAGHESELLDLKLTESDQVRTVIIQDIQGDPVTGTPLHIDFYEPDLTQPVDVEIEIELIGEAPAAEEKRGVLLFITEEVPVRVLPTQIPSSIEVDISGLNEVGDQISMEDVQLPEGVELMLENPEDVVVAKVGALRVQKVEEEEEETEEGAEVAEGEASTEEPAEKEE